MSFKGQTESTQFRQPLKLLLQHKTSAKVDLSTVTDKRNLLQATHKCILRATAHEHRAVSIMLRQRDLGRSLK